MAVKKYEGRAHRKKSIRKKIFGTTERPRLTVFRSGKHIYAQIIDDTQGKTLVAASTVEKDHSGTGSNKSGAETVGKKIGERAKAAEVETVVFDRNGYLFHGCIKVLADAARDSGLRF